MENAQVQEDTGAVFFCGTCGEIITLDEFDYFPEKCPSCGRKLCLDEWKKEQKELYGCLF